MNINPQNTSYRFSGTHVTTPIDGALTTFDNGFQPRHPGDEGAMTLKELKEMVDHPKNRQPGPKFNFLGHKKSEAAQHTEAAQKHERRATDQAAAYEALQSMKLCFDRLSSLEKRDHLLQYDRSLQLMLLSMDTAMWDSKLMDAWLIMDNILDRWATEFSIQRPFTQAIESAFESNTNRPQKQEIAGEHFSAKGNLGFEDGGDRGKKALLLRYQAIAFDLLANREGHQIKACPEITEFIKLLDQPTDSLTWSGFSLAQRSVLLLDACSHRALPAPNSLHQHVDLFIGRLFDQENSEYAKGILNALNHILSDHAIKEVSINALRYINTLAMGHRDKLSSSTQVFGLFEPSKEGIDEIFSLIQGELDNAISIRLALAWDSDDRYLSEPISKEVALLNPKWLQMRTEKNLADRTTIANRLISDFCKNHTAPPWVTRKTEAVKLAKCLDLLHLFVDGNTRTAHLMLKMLGVPGEFYLLTNPNHLESRSVKELEDDIEMNKAILSSALQASDSKEKFQAKNIADPLEESKSEAP